jgi:hypothetical protein
MIEEMHFASYLSLTRFMLSPENFFLLSTYQNADNRLLTQWTRISPDSDGNAALDYWKFTIRLFNQNAFLWIER